MAQRQTNFRSNLVTLIFVDCEDESSILRQGGAIKFDPFHSARIRHFRISDVEDV